MNAKSLHFSLIRKQTKKYGYIGDDVSDDIMEWEVMCAARDWLIWTRDWDQCWAVFGLSERLIQKVKWLNVDRNKLSNSTLSPVWFDERQSRNGVTRDKCCHLTVARQRRTSRRQSTFDKSDKTAAKARQSRKSTKSNSTSSPVYTGPYSHLFLNGSSQRRTDR